jgi:hypothetical protein
MASPLVADSCESHHSTSTAEHHRSARKLADEGGINTGRKKAGQGQLPRRRENFLEISQNASGKYKKEVEKERVEEGEKRFVSHLPDSLSPLS